MMVAVWRLQGRNMLLCGAEPEGARGRQGGGANLMLLEGTL